MSNSVYLTLTERIINLINLPSELVVQTMVNLTPGRFDFYFKAPLSTRLACHEALEALCTQSKGLRLVYSPKALNEESKLKSIAVTDGRLLLNALGVEIQSELVKDAILQLLNSVHDHVEWLHDIVTEVCAAWQVGKKPYSTGPEQVRKMLDAFTFIAWYEKQGNGCVNTDIRTLSAKLYGPTKQLENVIGLIASLYKTRLTPEISECKPAEIMAYLGVSRFPPNIQAKGPLVIHQKYSGQLDISMSWPSASCPPDAIEKIDVTKIPTYLLCIENKTTFERYTREINDNGLVVYTNGFPSRSWIRAFKLIETQLPRQVPIYHWGDVDEGGYKILAFLDRQFTRAVIPHCMLPSTVCTYDEQKEVSLDKLKDALLNSTSPSIEVLHTQIQALINSGQKVYWIEQEHLPILACMT